MKEHIRAITEEKNPAKVGLIVSVVIIIGALIPNIESKLITINNPYSFKMLLLGISIFFIFMGIKINYTTVGSKTVGGFLVSTEVLPPQYCQTSIACFWIAGVLFLIFILSFVIPFILTV